MDNAEYTEFKNYLEMGYDLTFLYHGKKYIVEGNHDGDGQPFNLDTIQLEPFDPEIGFTVSDLYNYDVKAFLAEPFFEGKSFSEIVGEVELLPE
jgi:hypothetical protein